MLNYKIKVGFFLIFFVFYAALAKSAVYADWSVDGNGNLVYTAPNGKVLGIVYAKDGDSGGGGGSGGDHGGGGGGGGGGDHGGGGSSGGDGGKTPSGFSIANSAGTSNVNNSSLVDCVGPDGKHSQISFQACSDFNKAWNNNNFSFQVIVKPQNSIQTQSVSPLEKTEKKKVDNEFKTESKSRNETENETKSGIKSENETENETASEGAKVKTRSKESEFKTETESGGVKVKIEQKDGKLEIKGEASDGSEIELGEQEVFKIEERLDKNTVKIATGSGNSFVFAKGTTAAQTQFPLSVDLKTNALTVQTPTGPKLVAILPDTAVQNILAANVINRLSTQNTASVGAYTALKSVTNTVVLGLRNGIPVYEINGISDQKILGFIPVSIEEKVVVSAQTGTLVTREETPFNSFLDLISF